MSVSKKATLSLLPIVAILITSGCTSSQPQTRLCEDSGIVVNINEACPTHWCGDGECLLYNEDCENCPQDCGKCAEESTEESSEPDIEDTEGELQFVVYSEGYKFAWVHAVSGYPEFIEWQGGNKYDIYVDTANEQHFPKAAFFITAKNIGGQQVDNIESTIICEEVSPIEVPWAITDSSTSYKGINLVEVAFNCANNYGFACDSYPNGNKVTYLKGCSDLDIGCEDSTGYRLGYAVSRWFAFEFSELAQDITLSCQVKVFAEEPVQQLSETITLNFFVDR